MQILRAVLISFWSILCLSGFYVLIKGGGSIITLISMLCVLATLFALNNKGGEAIRKIAMVYCALWVVLLTVFVVLEADRLINLKAILLCLGLLSVGILSLMVLLKLKTH